MPKNIIRACTSPSIDYKNKTTFCGPKSGVGIFSVSTVSFVGVGSVMSTTGGGGVLSPSSMAVSNSSVPSQSSGSSASMSTLSLTSPTQTMSESSTVFDGSSSSDEMTTAS